MRARITVLTREQFRDPTAPSGLRMGVQRAEPRNTQGGLSRALGLFRFRRHEATALRWRAIDFEKGEVTVTGGERGTKNGETRTVPMTEALRGLLLRLRDKR